MKLITYISTILVFLMTTGITHAQVQVEAFKNKDYTAIKSMLTEDVTVKVDSGSKIKGKSKGFDLIKSTLEAFAPTKMEMKHKGSSMAKDEDYLITKLFNSDSETLRIFIHLENRDGGRSICDIKMRHS